MRRITLTSIFALAMGLAAGPAMAEVPVTLQGSPASMQRQNGVAREMAFDFAGTPGHVAALESAGELVRLEGNEDYELAGFVKWPQARPEMRLFIERLARRYRVATGERLVVTSLIRPESEQPGNSHPLSVHPAGIAVDLRVSQRAASRRWLEDALLDLERRGVLDVTRERNPPHYHVALFPAAYMAHVEPLLAMEAVATEAATGETGKADDAPGSSRSSAAPVLVALLMVTFGSAAAVVHRSRSSSGRS